VTTLLAIIFLAGIVYDWWLRVKWLLQLAAYKLCGPGALGIPEWPAIEWPAISMDAENSDTTAVTTEAGVISVEMNPMAADDVKDVESNNKYEQ